MFINPYVFSSGTSLLLDDYPNALLAISIMQLRTLYTGYCIRIRRSSDNAETDVAFDSGGILSMSSIVSATGTLSAWIGGDSGYIVTGYDQSSNGYDFTVTTASKQPRIINAGVLELENALSTFNFTGANTLLNTDTISTASDYSIFIVSNRSDTAGYMFDTSMGRIVIDKPSSGYYFETAWRGGGFTHSTQDLCEFHLVASGGADIYQDNVSQATGLTYSQKGISALNAIGSNNSGSGTYITGTLQEFIVYGSDMRTDRAAIAAEINSRYSIY